MTPRLKRREARAMKMTWRGLGLGLGLGVGLGLGRYEDDLEHGRVRQLELQHRGAIGAELVHV